MIVRHPSSSGALVPKAYHVLVKFSEEERAHLRDPENARRFRRAMEAELHVGLLQSLHASPRSLMLVRSGS